MSNPDNTTIVVLAAGLGKRLRPLTDNKPKCMVEFLEKTLLDHQASVYQSFGFNEISIVTGHCTDTVKSSNISLNKFINTEFASTNMMFSLSKAFDLFDGSRDIIIAYGDIIFKQHVFQSLLNANHDISLITDLGWQKYWEMRADDVLSDAETFKWNLDNKVVSELGKKPQSLAEIQGQYIGLFKISKSFAIQFKKLYLALDLTKDSTRNMYITDFLQYIIDSGHQIHGVPINNSWLEFDSTSDFELYHKLKLTNELKIFYE